MNESDFNDDTSFEDENDEIIKQKGDQNDKDDGNISFYEQQSRARLLERNSSVNFIKDNNIDEDDEDHEPKGK